MSARHTAKFLSQLAWGLAALAAVFGLAWVWMSYPVVIGIWFVLSVPFGLLFLACCHVGRDGS